MIAGGETSAIQTILLHTPSPFSRRFNRDGDGMSAE